ncbi:MAG: serine kinase [Bacteroidales bacterium]|jgi:predicted transcriptional regulator
MKVSELVEKLGLVIYGGKQGLEEEISGGYVSDLLSDVMGHAQEGQVWVTLQTHKNVMAIASLKDLAAVVLISNNQPDEDMLAQSQEDGVPVLGTTLPAFEFAGKLYNLLHEDEIV